jgi:hypothetical protein
VINVRHVFFSIDPTQIPASPKHTQKKKSDRNSRFPENYKFKNPPGNSTLTITESNQIELHQTPVPLFPPPVMPLLQEKTTRKEKKFDSNERRLGLFGCLLHPLHVLSKPTKKKNKHDERSSSSSSFAG